MIRPDQLLDIESIKATVSDESALAGVQPFFVYAS